MESTVSNQIIDVIGENKRMENKEKYMKDILNYVIQSTKDVIRGDKIKLKCPNYKDYGLEEKDVEEIVKTMGSEI